jgi:nucleotide-binding universal stress UspA family protein
VDWKRIIVAIDDSPRSTRAVEHVGSMLGQRQDIHVCLLHIYPEPPPDWYRTGATLEDYRDARAGEATDLFARAKTILAGHGLAASAVTARCLMAEGKTISAAILDMQVQEHYGTIVVGKRGIPKAEEFLFGSISSALVHTGRDVAVWVVG